MNLIQLTSILNTTHKSQSPKRSRPSWSFCKVKRIAHFHQRISYTPHNRHRGQSPCICCMTVESRGRVICTNFQIVIWLTLFHVSTCIRLYSSVFVSMCDCLRILFNLILCLNTVCVERLIGWGAWDTMQIWRSVINGRKGLSVTSRTDRYV